MQAEVHSQVSQSPAVPLPLRSHNILGVCEALGEDFGFNPIWLRVPLAASVLVSPLYAVLGYFALGLVVLASRLVFPARRREQGVAPQLTAAAPANSEVEEKLAA